LFAPLGEYDGMIRKLQVLQQCTMADQVSMEFGMDIHAKFHGHLICHSALLQDLKFSDHSIVFTKWCKQLKNGALLCISSLNETITLV